MKKWIALLVCMLMVLPSSIGALAEKPDTPYSRALAEGKSASFATEMTWGSPSFLDEETNKVLELALGALSVSGSHGALENGDRFHNIDLNVRGNSVLAFDVYKTEQGVFVNSPIYGGAIAIDEDELPALFEIIGQAFLEMSGEELPDGMTFADLFEQMYEQQSQQLELAMAYQDMTKEEALDVMIAQFGLEELVTAVDAWAEGFVGVPYEGEPGEDLGEGVEQVLVYELSREQIIELLETVFPLIFENETFWNAVIEQQQTNPFVNIDEEMPSAQEIMEMLAEMDLVQEMKDALPEQTAFRQIEYLDADGVVLLSQAQLEVEGFAAVAEWVPGKCEFVLLAGEEENNITLIVSTADTLTETLGTMETVEDAMYIGLIVTADAEPVLHAGLNIGRHTLTDPNRYETSCTLGIEFEAMGGMEGTAQIVLSNTSVGGEEAIQVSALDIFVLEEMVFRFVLTKETGDVAPRFDPATYSGEILRPAQLDPEAFAAWIQGAVEGGLQQTLMRVMGSMPPELFAYIPMDMF